jgi:hypothetical protein
MTALTQIAEFSPKILVSAPALNSPGSSEAELKICERDEAFPNELCGTGNNRKSRYKLLKPSQTPKQKQSATRQ